MLDWRNWTVRGQVIWIVFILAIAYPLSKIAENSSLPDGVQVLAGSVEVAVVVLGIVITGRWYSAWVRRKNSGG